MRKRVLLITLVLIGLAGWKIYLAKNQSESKVKQVIDGDTIKLQNDEIIRYIGIDTPEKEDCFAQKAKTMNENLVLDRKIKLEFDENEIDKFGRKLAYVFVKEEKTGQRILVNEYLLQKGAGKFFLDLVNRRYEERLSLASQKPTKKNKACGKLVLKIPKKAVLSKAITQERENAFIICQVPDITNKL